MNLILPFLGIAGVSAIFVPLAVHIAMIPWRRSEGMHWTERARLLWPARKSIFAASLAGAALAVIGGSRIFGWEVPIVFVPAAVMLGSLALYPSVREVEPRYRFLVWLRELIWAFALKGAPALFALYLMGTMPEEMEATDGWIFLTLFLTSAFLVSGIWMPLVSSRCEGGHRLAEMQQRLDRIAAEASTVGGVVPRHVWLADTPLANAFALPLNRSVIFTTRAMEILDDEECRAVMLHEYSHLREPFLMGLLRVVSSVSYLVIVFVRPVLHAWGATGLMGLVFGYLLFQRFAGKMMRRMEHQADSMATGPEGDSPVYARALEKLHEANQLPAVMPGNRMVHPHLYDRMLAAGLTPDYPRPAAPSGWSPVSLICLGIAFAAIVGLFWI
ncbi:MAG: M48 family metalloprotease [Verrucomicrobiales bacterium]|nr:M48 family metalloprotease [Verrucomicrobiales bacterium]